MALKLKNGKWIKTNNKNKVFEIQDNVVNAKHVATFDHPDVEFATLPPKKWIVGTFGVAPKYIQEITGQIHFNLQMGKNEGFLTEDGKTIYTIAYSGVGFEKIKWVSDDELQEILDAREPWNKPSTFYKIQPEIQGKIIIIGGSPGSGKTTSAFLLAKNHGFVYYEGDCFMHSLNPYIPLDVSNPTMQHVMQAPLKNYPKKTIKAVREFHTKLKFTKRQPDEKTSQAYYEAFAKHVKLEHERIGGKYWVVSQVVPSENYRDLVRKILGPKCFFINMSLSSETQRQRLKQRYKHLQKDHRKEFIKIRNKSGQSFEHAGPDEKNAQEIVITPDLSKEDVIQKILNIVKSF